MPVPPWRRRMMRRCVLSLGLVLLVVPAVAAHAEPSRAHCTINGTKGDDVLRGTDRRDVICGRGGNDTIYGRGGNDVLYGGPGDDRLVGGRGYDTLDGQEGDDVKTDIPGTGGNPHGKLGDGQQQRINVATTYDMPAGTRVTWIPEIGHCDIGAGQFAVDVPVQPSTITSWVLTSYGDGSCEYQASNAWWRVEFKAPDGNTGWAQFNVTRRSPFKSDRDIWAVDCESASNINCVGGEGTERVDSGVKKPELTVPLTLSTRPS
jgi:RTX calcium-binding nonapeptide repeat (4 copies)